MESANGSPATPAWTPGSAEEWQALSRFLVGSALRGARELRSRTQSWNATLDVNQAPLPNQWDEAFAIRRVLIGLLFESPKLVHEHVLPAGQRWATRWRRRLRAVERLPGGSALMEQLIHARIRVQTELIRLAEVGRIEEWRSTALAELAWRDLTSTTIDTFSQAAQIREVVLEQGATLTEESAERLRESAARADNAVENLLRSLFHRRRDSTPPRGPQAPDMPIEDPR